MFRLFVLSFVLCFVLSFEITWKSLVSLFPAPVTVSAFGLPFRHLVASNSLVDS